MKFHKMLSRNHPFFREHSFIKGTLLGILWSWAAVQDGLAFAAPNDISPLVSPAFVISPETILTPPSSDEFLEPSSSEPLFIALFGDSVSMATMADAKFGNPGPRFYANFIGSGALAALYQNVVAPHRPELTPEGQHELINNLFGNMTRKHLSPYLGTQDYSLPILTRDLTGAMPKVYNGAQLAGSYYFGKIYLDKFEKFFQRHPFHKKPDLVLVNFNGMDFIENRGAQVYGEKIRQFYSRLTALAPYSTLVVTGIGDPVDLLTHPDRVAVAQSPIGPIKCSDLYKFLRFGNGLGLYPGAPQATIEKARSLLAVLRGQLKNEVELINHDRDLYPHFKGKAVYVDPENGDGMSSDRIAADCIHPDAEAQRHIGESMWQVIQPLL
jgi:hypothetical protein